MRATTGTAGTAGIAGVPGLVAAVVVSIVLGILGMHALSTHGAGDTDHATMAAPAAGAVPGTHADGSADAGGGGDGHDLDSMVMLCAAMLAATAVVLLGALGARRPPRLWAHVATATRTAASRRSTSRRGTGPPPDWEFSVLRC